MDHFTELFTVFDHNSKSALVQEIYIPASPLWLSFGWLSTKDSVLFVNPESSVLGQENSITSSDLSGPLNSLVLTVIMPILLSRQGALVPACMKLNW